MTKREMLAQILAHTTDSAEIEFLNKEIALLDKQKSRRSGALTDTQKENIVYAGKFVGWMGTLPQKSATIADVRKHFGLTAQRVVPIMTKLVNEGKLTYTVEKKVKVYTLCD